MGTFRSSRLEARRCHVTAITGYRHWRNAQAREVDYSEADLVYIPYGAAQQSFDTFTQEVRVAGQAGRLNWLTGAFYSREKAFARDGYRVGRDFERFLDAQLSGPTGLANPISFYTGLPVGQSYPEGSGVGRDDFRQRAESISLFTHNEFAITDRLRLIAGLRYTRETKNVVVDIVGSNNPGCAALVAKGLSAPGATPISSLQCLQLYDQRYNGQYKASRKEAEWSGVGTISYEISDLLSSYATYSRGYKAGGFALDRAGFRPISQKAPYAADLMFAPEFATNYELGLKLQTRDRSLTINSALFHTRFDDFQLSYNAGAALITTNIPEVTTKGFEIESTLRPVQAFTVAVGVTYADARYGVIPAGPPANIISLSGRQLANSPRWVVTGSIGWDDRIGSGRLRAFGYLDWRYQSEVQTERLLRANSGQEGFGLINGRIGFGDADEIWTVELWSRNLLDHRYIGATIPASFQGATVVSVPGEPRTFGLTLRSKM